MGEADAFGGETVAVGSAYRRNVAAEIATADVVGEDQHEVW